MTKRVHQASAAHQPRKTKKSSHIKASSASGGYSKRRQPRRLTEHDFLSVCHMTQEKAAETLDVCLSTFKRQLRKSGIRWKTPTEQKQIAAAYELRDRMYQLLQQIEEPCDSESRQATLFQEIQACRDPYIRISQKSVIDFAPEKEMREMGATSALRQQFVPPEVAANLVDHNQNTLPTGDHLMQDSDPLNQTYNPSTTTTVSTVLAARNQELKHLCYFQTLLLEDMRKTLYSIPSIYNSPSGYRGDLSYIPGPWTKVLQENPMASINLSDVSNLKIISTSLGYRLMCGHSEIEFIKGKTVLDTMVTVYDESYYKKFFSSIMQEGKKLMEVVDSVRTSRGEIFSCKLRIHFESEYNLIWAEFHRVDSLSGRVRLDADEIDGDQSVLGGMKQSEMRNLITLAQTHVALLGVVEDSIPRIKHVSSDEENDTEQTQMNLGAEAGTAASANRHGALAM